MLKIGKRDLLAEALEYVIVLMFIRGAFTVLFQVDTDTDLIPAVFSFLVGDLAATLYGLFFLSVAILMLYAKWFKKTRLHKWILFSMFLTTAYFLPLSIVNNAGFHAGQIQIVFAMGATAWLWLRWKLKTEYVDPKKFRKELFELTKD